MSENKEQKFVRVPVEDLADVVSKALRRAWQLGQIYWQQADSEYASYHKKADETNRKFEQLVDETRAAIIAAAPKADHPCGNTPYDEGPFTIEQPQAQPASAAQEREAHDKGETRMRLEGWEAITAAQPAQKPEGKAERQVEPPPPPPK